RRRPINDAPPSSAFDLAINFELEDLRAALATFGVDDGTGRIVPRAVLLNELREIRSVLALPPLPRLVDHAPRGWPTSSAQVERRSADRSRPAYDQRARIRFARWSACARLRRPFIWNDRLPLTTSSIEFASGVTGSKKTARASRSRTTSRVCSAS